MQMRATKPNMQQQYAVICGNRCGMVKNSKFDNLNLILDRNPAVFRKCFKSNPVGSCQTHAYVALCSCVLNYAAITASSYLNFLE